MSDINIFKKLITLALPLDRLPLHQKEKFKKLKTFNYGLEGNSKFSENFVNSA